MPKIIEIVAVPSKTKLKKLTLSFPNEKSASILKFKCCKSVLQIKISFAIENGLNVFV
jgi:hypothetical protein